MKIPYLVKAALQQLLQSHLDFVHLATTTSSTKTPSGNQQTTTECILVILALRLALSMVP
jgi:hypothetical protein